MGVLKKIKELCKENGENIAMLERTLGFGNGTISHWENANTTTDKLAKVADHFGVSIDYLLGRSELQNSGELDNVYLSLMQQAQAQKISPEDIELAIRTIREIRKN